MRESLKHFRAHDLRLLGFALSVLAPLAHGAPVGGEVTAGSGVIGTNGTTLTVEQASARLAINWQSFNIGADESVVFQQPSVQAIALNRILGQDPSLILGNLTANGQVFLLNPNGVLFGATAQVDVGGLLASTLKLSNEDFLTGRYRLEADPGSTGEVINAGTLNAHDGGYVALAGTQVTNEGVIRARMGTVALGAGEQLTLNIDGAALVNFSVDTAALTALVSNRHLLQADGGTVLLTARAQDAVLSNVINHTGIIEARSVSAVNGTIRLEGGNDGVVAVAGTLDVSGRNGGETGGEVLVTGDKVALLDGARVDASGSVGGGTVRIGGDYQGGNAAVQNAQRTFVGTAAEIRADALESGAGGRVIVWSDGDTRYSGAISARGGRFGGDGGFVEVSGKQQLGFDGSVDTSSVFGTTGTLLLDPDDLTIAAAPVGGAIEDALKPFQATDGVNDYYVLGTTLTALPANTAVVLQANHDIIFQTSLAMPTTAAGSLSLTATNAITMGGFDLSTLNGNVSMTAGAGGITNLGAINLGSGVLTLNSSGAITQNNNVVDVISGATSLVKQGLGTLTLSGANSYIGTTTVNGGTLQLGAANRITDGNVVTIAAGATFDLNNFAETIGSIAGAGTIALGSATLTISLTGSSQFLGGINGSGGLTKIGAGTLELRGTNTYTGVTTVNAGTLRLGCSGFACTAGNAIADTAPVILANAAGVTLDVAANETIGTLSGGGASGGNITLNGNFLTVNQVGTTTFGGVASGTGGLSKSGVGTLVLAGANTYSGETKVLDGTLQLSAANRLADATALTVGSGAVFDMNGFTETVGSIAGAGSINLSNVTLTTGANNTTPLTPFSGVLSGTGSLSKVGTGALTLAGANTYSGVTNVNAGMLVAANANALGATSSGTSVANGATLQIANAAVVGEAVTLNGAGVGGFGALTGSGSASFSGAVALQSATTIGATNPLDTLTLNNALTGGFDLSQAGQGTVAFANTVNVASFVSGANATTRINAGLVTAGAQTYNGALVTGNGATLQTTNAAITANGAVNAAAGTLTLQTGTGAVAMTNAANDFGTVAITNAGAVNLIDANDIAFGTSNVASLRAQSIAGDVRLDSSITANGGGDSIVLAAGGKFVNNVGPTGLNPGAGRWLVWSSTPALDARGGLVYAFKQYDAHYPVTAVAGTGNGFLYSIAPIVTLGLTGTVSKVYDGTVDAVLTAENYALDGALDGDTVAFNGPLPLNATYDTRDAGNNKVVSVAGVSITGASDGAAAVYGYQFGDAPVTGAIGVISPAFLTITAITNTKTYDGTVTAAALPTVTGLLGGDTITELTEIYADKNAGSSKPLVIEGYIINDGNGGNNYTVSTVNDSTGVIETLAVTGTITVANRDYDGTANATVINSGVIGAIPGDDVFYDGGTATFADKVARNGKIATGTGFSLFGVDAPNYTANDTATTTANVRRLALLGSFTAANKPYDGNKVAIITSRTLTGVLPGDIVNYIRGAAEFDDKRPGLGKTVTATGMILSGPDARNYSVTAFPTTTADIDQILITADIAAAKSAKGH